MPELLDVMTLLPDDRDGDVPGAIVERPDTISRFSRSGGVPLVVMLAPNPSVTAISPTP